MSDLSVAQQMREFADFFESEVTLTGYELVKLTHTAIMSTFDHADLIEALVIGEDGLDAMVKQLTTVGVPELVAMTKEAREDEEM